MLPYSDHNNELNHDKLIPSSPMAFLGGDDLEKGLVAENLTAEISITSTTPADGRHDSFVPPPSALLLPTTPGANSKPGNSSLPRSFGELTPTRRDARPFSPDQQTLLQSPPAIEAIPLPSPNGVFNAPLDPQSDIPTSLNQYNPFWKAYNDDADAQDKEIVESLGADLDALLIFAGLFSASNVAFIVEAYKDLKEDNTNTTNYLLRTLIQNQVSPSNTVTVNGPLFTPSSRAIRVNALFFASLSCSLFTAFGAVLGKQWLNHYKKEGRRMTLAERGRERQRRFMGLELWHLEHVIETLPTLLQFSLFLFLGALIDFVWPIDHTIAGIIAGFSVVTFSFYAITTTIAVRFPSAPFQTRFSALLRKAKPFYFRLFTGCSKSAKQIGVYVSSILMVRAKDQGPVATVSLHSHSDSISTRPRQPFAIDQRPLPPVHRSHDDSDPSQDELNHECISWLLATSTIDKTLSVAATAALMLPEVARKKAVVLNKIPYVLRLVLGARAFESKVILDVQPASVKAVLEPIHALVMKWDYARDLVVPTLGDNSSFVTAFEGLLWRVVRAYPIEGMAAIWILEMLVKLGFTVEPYWQEIDLLYRAVLQTFMPDSLLGNVLGSIVFLESSMSFSSIIDLLDLSMYVSAWDIANMLQPLHGSMILIDENRFIRIAHRSVRSFFADPTRCQIPNFTTSSTLRHTRLASRCVSQMKMSLRRNILGTDNHLLLNGDISDLGNKLTNAGVSESLRYACRHWATHLKFSSPGDSELRDAVEYFCKTALLPWFEVMSLLDCYDETPYIVGHAEAWMRAGDLTCMAATLLQDMHRFIMLFKESVKLSAAAIYSVALPLAYPSLLHTHYHKDTPSLRIYPKGPVNFWISASKVISPHIDNVNAIAVSRDNSRILSGSRNGIVRLFAMSNGECIATFEGHKSRIRNVAFAPDGNFVISGSNDGTVKIWDTNTRSLRSTLEGHRDMVLTVNVSPDNRYVVSGGSDTTVRLWRASTGSHIATMEGHSKWVQCVLFSPDSRKILSASKDTTIRIWNTADRTLLAELRHLSNVWCAAFSSDGMLIASGGDDGTVKIWDAESHSLIRTLVGHLEYITSLAFSSNGNFIVSSSWDCTIRVWDVLDASVRAVLEGHGFWIRTVSFSLDQKYIVSGGGNADVRIWNWKDSGSVSTPIKPSVPHNSRVTAIAFSSDGKIMASGGADGEVHIWDIVNLVHIMKLEGRSESISSIYFSPDSKYVTATSSTLTTSWDLNAHTIVASSIVPYHGPLKQPTWYEMDESAAGDSVVKYKLELHSNTIYARQFGLGQAVKSKPMFRLPIPNISADGVHGCHLAVGTKGGQIMILDFSSIVSFETMFSEVDK